MPKVWVKNNDITIDAMMLRSLLSTLQINNILIETRCGGEALCGKCAIRIINGMKRLSPMRLREKERLTAMGAEDDIRLACQAYPGKDIEIEVINYERKKI